MLKNLNKITLIGLSLIIIQSYAFCNEQNDNSVITAEAPITYTAAQQPRNTVVFSENNKFGLKDKNGNIIAPPVYQKIIMTGRNGWIIQKNNKFGLMDSQGKYLIKPKYRNADRILGRYIKLGNDRDYGIYNEFGEILLEPKYSSIELLYGKMFLTYKNFKYGVADFKGNILIPNICDYIYMPEKNIMRIKYKGNWIEISDASADKLKDIELAVNTQSNSTKGLKDIILETGALSGYSVLTISDYSIKIFSSISHAHEETIDDLILSHGVDTVNILKRFSWIPKYPITYFKNYFSYFRNPNNGPLSDQRNKLKNKR